MAPSDGVVEAHYDHFPYPTINSLGQPLPGGYKRGALNYLLRRRRGQGLPADARIWVAGCGTQQGAHWGMSFPQAEIIATDLSETTLGIAQDLARQLGVTNVRFEKQDLMQPRFHDEFDFIVSTGVIHHLPDPAVGLSHLRQALRPDGAAFLMVYNTLHREPLRYVREAAALLADETDNADDRYDLLCTLLEAQLASKQCSPPCPEALQQLLNLREDRSFVADALLHPLETTYDVDGLLALLHSCGLRHVNWYRPILWDLARYISDEALVSRFRQRDRVAQWNMVYNLAGYAAPQLEVLVEPVETPPRGDYTLDELRQMPVGRCKGAYLYRVEEGTVRERMVMPAYGVQEDQLGGRDCTRYDQKIAWQIPAYVKPVLDACNGQRTLGELIEMFSADFDEHQLMQLFLTFLPDEFGVLVPTW